jgi:hypothetical protein
MYKNFMDILNVLYKDETLLRLLYYPAENLDGNVKDPLDVSLPNILDIDSDWSIRNSRIMKAPKDDDLNPDNPICRIFVFAGRRTGDNGNYALATQNVVIDIFCHNSFEEGDLRTTRILDRLNELFVYERITGITKMDFLNGDNYPSPSGYVGYRSTYKYGSIKK